MEQPRYWMWTKRRQGLATYDDSWEEQAFAEDAAGTLGGCVWPPRSYSCSFCRREFRSAQALGGHMNVHRRDRARLKQSPNPRNENFQSQPPFASLGSLQYQSHHHKNHPQVCSFLSYNPNPNSVDQDQTCPERNLLRTFSSQASKEEEKLSSKSLSSSPKSCSSSGTPNYHFPDLGKETDHHNKRARIEEGGFRVRADDLSVSLNLFVRRARPASPGRREEDQAGIAGCKRKRMENWALPNLLLLKPIAVDHRSPSSIDHELDLELRLGGSV